MKNDELPPGVLPYSAETFARMIDKANRCAWNLTENHMRYDFIPWLKHHAPTILRLATLRKA